MANTDQDIVTMSTLGKKGRFGNQVFQYAFLKIYAKVFDLKVETPEWVGHHLFGTKDPPITKNLPVIFEEKQTNLESLFKEPKPRYKNVDFFGFYQFHTSNFAPFKDYFRSLFVPTPQINSEMKKGLMQLSSKGKTLVGLQIRRGDYKKYGNSRRKKVFFIAPVSWYKKWLNSIWADLDSPVLFIASDEINVVATEFSKYNPVTSKDLYPRFPRPDFYPDFYMLTQCDIMIISNSTFSFTASMLNKNAGLFLRPDIDAKKLIQYDPWNSLPLLNRIRSYY